MAEVETVEIAESEDASPKLLGDSAIEGETLHWTPA
jgi:hypothetical protein